MFLVCREGEFSILGRGFFLVGRREQRWSAYFIIIIIIPQVCRWWREYQDLGSPDLPASLSFLAMSLIGPAAQIHTPRRPGSARCSWSQALSQVSNGHFGLQFLFLNRPPISESCFNKHSIKRKKPLGDGRHPITEKQGMFTEESDFSLVTSSWAKIYEPVCPTAIKPEMWSLNWRIF